MAYRCDVSDVDADKLAAVTAAAQQVLWGLTGRRLGVCLTVGEFVAAGERCRATGRGSCCAIRLRPGPVRSVESVEIDGVPVDGWRLVGDVLLREGCWPVGSGCDPTVVTVVYRWGVPVPEIGALALGELACEMLAGLDGADCRLPSNAVSITRQGVTVDLGDAETVWRQGRVGLPFVDQFIRYANPSGLVEQVAVYSPDVARRVR